MVKYKIVGLILNVGLSFKIKLKTPNEHINAIY